MKTAPHLGGTGRTQKYTPELFWSRVDKSGGADSCWPWTGYRLPNGYGRLSYQYKRGLAHRVAWTLTHGEIPAGLVVMHKCDNPPCCNPSHLAIGTQQDNCADCSSKMRQAHGEQLPGAKLTWVKVREIRRVGKEGATRRGLARRFGVTSQVILRILTGRAWIHDPENPSPKERNSHV